MSILSVFLFFIFLGVAYIFYLLLFSEKKKTTKKIHREDIDKIKSLSIDNSLLNEVVNAITKNAREVDFENKLDYFRKKQIFKSNFQSEQISIINDAEFLNEFSKVLEDKKLLTSGSYIQKQLEFEYEQKQKYKDYDPKNNLNIINE